MKTLLLSILLALCAHLSAFSQKKIELDVVYLKTDSILRGEIIDSIPGVSITLKTVNEEYLFIPRNEIDRIKQKIYIKSHKEYIPMPSDSLYTGSSYWFWIQGGGGLLLEGDKTLRFQMDMINGLREQSEFGIGLGIGVRYSGNEYPFLVPVYLHLQSAAMKGNLAPMIAIGAGVVSNPDLNWVIAGPFIRVDMGIQNKLESGGFFTITAGFEQLNFFDKGYDFVSPKKVSTLNYLTINLGFMF